MTTATVVVAEEPEHAPAQPEEIAPAATEIIDAQTESSVEIIEANSDARVAEIEAQTEATVAIIEAQSAANVERTEAAAMENEQWQNLNLRITVLETDLAKFQLLTPELLTALITLVEAKSLTPPSTPLEPMEAPLSTPTELSGGDVEQVQREERIQVRAQRREVFL